MNKYREILSVAICVMLLNAFSIEAKADSIQRENIGCENTVVLEQSGSEEISPYATDVVYKYRIYNGVLQYRRWNEVKAIWVDPYWINV